MGLAADDGIIATVAAKGSTGATYGFASVSAVLGYLASMDWVTISGVCLGLGTAVVNAYYKRQRNKRESAAAADDHEFKLRADKRAELESQARIALMQSGKMPADE